MNGITGANGADFHRRGWFADIDDPKSLITGRYAVFNTYNAFGLALSGGMAYVADDWAGLKVIDTSELSLWKVYSTVPTPEDANSVALSGGNAYVTDGDHGLHVFDVSDPCNPEIISTVDTDNYANSVTLSGGFAYVAAGGKLQVIDIGELGNPSAPVPRGSFEIVGEGAMSVAISGDHAYVAYSGAGLQIIDISDPDNLNFVGSVSASQDGGSWAAKGVAISGGHAMLN